MKHFYIKVPPHVAHMLGITEDFNKKLPDGNYMALITHFVSAKICQMWEIEKKAPSMGCLVLKPFQMKEEQMGIKCHPLPAPTDPKFMPPQHETPSEPQLPVQFDEESDELVEAQQTEEQVPEEGVEDDGND